eukprot:g1327.t2
MSGPSSSIRYSSSPRQSRLFIQRSRYSVSLPKTVPLCRDNPYRPDVPKDRRAGRGGDWLKRLFSRFTPLSDRSKTSLVLDFEKPLINLDNRIKEVRRVAEENGVDVSEQIKVLEERSKQLRRETYNKLTPNQRLQVARHPNRPTCLDIVMNITDKFIELHGDRAGLDDKAILAGIGSINGMSCMFIGHQKGRNTKENIERNFGMAQPAGFRKALRFMRHANKFGLPIVTFVDTPGAYAGLKAEELGQGEAIAVNLREMFSLRVPVISIVIGEGGSGGALAINCANKVLIMENAVYYVASPEACAAILWKSRDKAAEAAKALRITANDLMEFGIVDEIIPEPLGGSHSDPLHSFAAVKDTVWKWLEHYVKMTEEKIMEDRYLRYREFGVVSDFLVRGGNLEEAVKARRESKGVFTKAGTWCVDEEEKEYIEKAVDYSERWQEVIKGREKWIRKPEFEGQVKTLREAFQQAKDEGMFDPPKGKENEVFSK